MRATCNNDVVLVTNNTLTLLQSSSSSSSSLPLLPPPAATTLQSWEDWPTDRARVSDDDTHAKRTPTTLMVMNMKWEDTEGTTSFSFHIFYFPSTSFKSNCLRTCCWINMDEKSIRILFLDIWFRHWKKSSYSSTRAMFSTFQCATFDQFPSSCSSFPLGRLFQSPCTTYSFIYGTEWVHRAIVRGEWPRVTNNNCAGQHSTQLSLHVFLWQHSETVKCSVSGKSIKGGLRRRTPSLMRPASGLMGWAIGWWWSAGH